MVAKPAGTRYFQHRSIIWSMRMRGSVQRLQMMTLCWKYLVPAGFAALIFTLLWQMIATWYPVLERITALAVLAGALFLTWRFLVQTRKNVSLIAHERVDLSNW